MRDEELSKGKPTPKNLRVAIFEDKSGGHRLAWVAMLVRHLRARGAAPPLLILSPGVRSTHPYRTFLKPLERKFHMRELEGAANPGAFERYRRFARCVRGLEAEGYDLLLVPTAESLARYSGLASLAGRFRPRLPIRAVILRFPIVYPDLSPKDRVLGLFHFLLELRAPMTCFYLDGYGVETVRRRFGIELMPIPDPLGRTRAFSWKGPRRPPVFGSLGFFDPRKEIPFLLEAFLRAKFRGKPRFFLGGPSQDPALPAAAREARRALGPGRFTHEDRILSPTAYRRALERLDVVCLPYRDHAAPSGTFHQVARSGRVLVVPDTGWMKWAGRGYPRVRYYEAGSSRSLAETLEEVENRLEEYRRTPARYSMPEPREFARILCGS